MSRDTLAVSAAHTSRAPATAARNMGRKQRQLVRRPVAVEQKFSLTTRTIFVKHAYQNTHVHTHRHGLCAAPPYVCVRLARGNVAAHDGPRARALVRRAAPTTPCELVACWWLAIKFEETRYDFATDMHRAFRDVVPSLARCERTSATCSSASISSCLTTRSCVPSTSNCTLILQRTPARSVATPRRKRHGTPLHRRGLGRDTRDGPTTYVARTPARALVRDGTLVGGARVQDTQADLGCLTFFSTWSLEEGGMPSPSRGTTLRRRAVTTTRRPTRVPGAR